MAAVVLLFSSCEDFTDVQPKGKNLLTTTEQLETLLNQEYDGCSNDMRLMAGDMIYAYSNISTLINRPVKSRAILIWTYDEENMDRLADLTSSDDDYTKFYGYIGQIANPILSKVDDATGTESAKKALKAEALTMRAWSLYVLVNKFAKAYNPSTAATDPGIINMTEDKDIQQSYAQSTVAEIYDQILSDINQAIELDALPDVAVNKYRMNKPAAYAVKALALLNMQRWAEAEEAAKAALEINDAINDYFESYIGTTYGYIEENEYTVIDRGLTGTEEDYFLNGNMEAFNCYTAETVANFEEGHVYYNGIESGNMVTDYTMDYGEDMLGQAGFFVSHDLNSRWNDGGLRAPQMYLAIAECELHQGNIDTAMDYLDQVREKRIDPEVYQPLAGNVTTTEEAIAHVKQVVMEEDLYSVNIFFDKKRWNQIDGWKATYSRVLDGKEYSIAPDSKMWIFPFPKSVINNNKLVKQNYNQ